MTIASRFAPLLFVVIALSLTAQTAASRKVAAPAEPLIVDVHRSPYRSAIVYTTNARADRFDLRHASVFDMIELAYGLGEQDDDRENAAIVGGPSWIDLDRFDVVAKVPGQKISTLRAASTSEAARMVMQRVLAERFHLRLHRADRPLPGYVVTLAQGGAKLAAAKDPAAGGECRTVVEEAGSGQTLTCSSETLGQFVVLLGDVFPHPVSDRTGLTTKFDFSLKLVVGPEVRTRDDLDRVYTSALGRQLGLVVAAGEVAQPAIVVDAVDRVPTANLSDIAMLLPALPDNGFEVASIRLTGPDETFGKILLTGSQVTFSGFMLQELIVRAWDLRTGAALGKALAQQPRTRFTILVKLPPGVDGAAIYQDQDQVNAMLQKLLIDRFQVKYHWGEWTQPDAYVLTAGLPRMKPAAAGSRSFCKFGPAEGQKTMRGANSPYDGEFHCQNVTMGEFADLAQAMAGADIKNRVPDETGLRGSYDFTLFYTTGRTLRTRTAAAMQDVKPSDNAAVAVEGLGVEEAFRKQLGLRLEKRPLTLPALILDPFAQTPSEN